MTSLYPCVEILTVTLYILKGETLERGLKDTQQEHHAELENRLPPGITAGFLDLDLPASRPGKSEAAVVYEFALL